LKNAAKAFLDKMAGYNGPGTIMKTAIYKMGPPQTPALGQFGMPTSFQVQGLTDDVAKLKSAVDALPEQGSTVVYPGQSKAKDPNFEVINSEWLGVSDVRPVLDEVKARIGPQGSGNSAADPEKWVIIVTDGMFTKRTGNSLQLFMNPDNSDNPKKTTVQALSYDRKTSEKVPSPCAAIREYNIATITVRYYINDYRPTPSEYQDYWRANCQNKGDFYAESDADLVKEFSDVFGTLTRLHLSR
jgi:hypothetical protein